MGGHWRSRRKSTRVTVRTYKLHTGSNLIQDRTRDSVAVWQQLQMHHNDAFIGICIQFDTGVKHPCISLVCTWLFQRKQRCNMCIYNSNTVSAFGIPLCCWMLHCLQRHSSVAPLWTRCVCFFFWQFILINIIELIYQANILN